MCRETSLHLMSKVTGTAPSHGTLLYASDGSTGPWKTKEKRYKKTQNKTTSFWLDGVPFFFPSFFFQKRVRRSFKLCFNHFAKVLSPPITCKAIVLLANSSSGAFIKTPPPCLMLMNPRTRSFLMILRKCSPLLSPSYHHLPCSPLLFFSHLSNSPLGF